MHGSAAAQVVARLFSSSKGHCLRQRCWPRAVMSAAVVDTVKRPKLAAGCPSLHTKAGAPLAASPAASPKRRPSSASPQRAGPAAAGNPNAAELATAAVEGGAGTAGAPAQPPNEELSAGGSANADATAPQPQAPKPRRPVEMPTPIPPPRIPLGEEPWHNGVLLVDKPKTWTSFDVCAKLRSALRQIKVKKVGHAGTLDPMATGLLIVCVGRGTKAVDSFMSMTKEYSGTLRLGEGTPSYDADSEVTERLAWEHISDEQLLAARDGFLGEIQQVPPMFSALKVGGKRLYEVARAGGEVERAPRTITVDAFDLERDAADQQLVHFRVVCSKGTYIRSLAHDLGRALGTAAHLTALRREAIGEYRVADAWQVEELADQLYQRRRDARGGAAGAQAGLAAEGPRGEVQQQQQLQQQQQQQQGDEGGQTGGAEAAA